MMSGFHEAFPSGCPLVYSGQGVSSFHPGPRRLRRTVLFLLTEYASGLVNVVASIHVLIGTAHYIFQVRLTDLPSPIRKGLWATSVFVTLMCSYYLLLLTHSLPLKLVIFKFRRCGRILLLQLMFTLFSLGIVSTIGFSNTHYKPANIVENFNWNWKIQQHLTVVVGIFQKFLATLLISVALPVAERWSMQMQPASKRAIVQLLPWKVILFLHHHLVLLCNTDTPFDIAKDIVLIAGIVFDTLFLVWLLFLAIYIAYELSLPCKSEGTWSGGKREMVRIPRKYFEYPLKSVVVTGLSPGHYALKYKGYDLEKDRENKGLLRTNTIVHEQCRITFSELE